MRGDKDEDVEELTMSDGERKRLEQIIKRFNFRHILGIHSGISLGIPSGIYSGISSGKASG